MKEKLIPNKLKQNVAARGILAYECEKNSLYILRECIWQDHIDFEGN